MALFARFLAVTLTLISINNISGLPNVAQQIVHSYPKLNLPYSVVYKWKEIDLQFSSPAEREAAIKNGEFIPENNIPIGMKVHKHRMFLSLPRLKSGVPSTLNYVNYDSTVKNATSPVLIAYPDWEHQKLGNCNGFQSVHSMEVDQFDRLWIIDTGRNSATKEASVCKPKVVIMDLNTDRIVSTHEFQAEVVSPVNGYLNDIVVACTTPESCYAYITNSGQNLLTVFDLAGNKSWSLFHSTMLADPAAGNVTILGKQYSIAGAGINGIGLSSIGSNFSELYYTPQSSFKLFSIRTEVIKASSNSTGTVTLNDSDVKHRGTKKSQAAGMILDSRDKMYFTALSENAVHYWDATLEELNSLNEVEYIQSDEDLEWPDTFSFDNQGNLFFTSTKVNRFFSNQLIPNEYQFRVLRVATGTRSYIFSGAERNFCPNLQTFASVMAGLVSLFICRQE